jgi:hypothetical protein
LLATVLQLYIILPICVGIGMYLYSENSLHIWEDWALGCVLAALMVRRAGIQPMSCPLLAWDAITVLISPPVFALLVICKIQFTCRSYALNQRTF